MRDIAQTLRKVRIERGLSQRELSEISGIGQGSISFLERGRHKARPSTLRKLQAALGAPLTGSSDTAKVMALQAKISTLGLQVEALEAYIDILERELQRYREGGFHG